MLGDYSYNNEGKINSIKDYIYSTTGTVNGYILHLYAYCANNPINYIDPSGHSMINVVCAIIGGVCGWKFGDYIAKKLGYCSGYKYWSIRTAVTVGGAALGWFLATRLVKIIVNYLKTHPEQIIKIARQRGAKVLNLVMKFLGINPFTISTNKSKFIEIVRIYNNKAITISYNWTIKVYQHAKNLGYRVEVHTTHEG